MGVQTSPKFHSKELETMSFASMNGTEQAAAVNEIEHLMKQMSPNSKLDLFTSNNSLSGDRALGGETGSDTKKSKVIFSVKKNQQSTSNYQPQRRPNSKCKVKSVGK